MGDSEEVIKSCKSISKIRPSPHDHTILHFRALYADASARACLMALGSDRFAICVSNGPITCSAALINSSTNAAKGLDLIGPNIRKLAPQEPPVVSFT